MPNSLIIDEIVHGLVAIPFAYLLWKKTKSYKKVALLFIFTYFVDLDHLVDFFSFYGFKFNLTNFFNAEYFRITQKAYIPFHAWEWLLILAGLTKIKGWKSFYAVILLALLPHFIYDSLRVGSFLSYSIVVRALNQFHFR